MAVIVGVGSASGGGSTSTGLLAGTVSGTPGDKADDSGDDGPFAASTSGMTRRRRQRHHVPLLPCVRRVLLVTVDDLALPRQRALHKGALLFVELAQHAQGGALVDHAPALSAAAGVTRTLSTCSNVGNGASGRRHRLARGRVLVGRRLGVLLLGACSSNGHGSRTRHGRLYSHGSRHIAVGGIGPGRVR